MFNQLFTNEIRAFGPDRNPKNIIRIFLALAICQTLIPLGLWLGGSVSWFNWLGLLFWIFFLVEYKLYKNHVAYGMTSLQYSTWNALRDLSEQTQHRTGIDKKMISGMIQDECYTVRKELWALRDVELENIKVANNYQDRQELLTAGIEDAKLMLLESTAAMRELMRDDRDDIEEALQAESKAVSQA